MHWYSQMALVTYLLTLVVGLWLFLTAEDKNIDIFIILVIGFPIAFSAVWPASWVAGAVAFRGAWEEWGK